MLRPIAAVAAVLALAACDDNPTALGDLNPEVEFEITGDRVETFDEVPVHVHVMANGAPMMMQEARLEVAHASDANRPYVFNVEEHEGEYEAHVFFFEEGEHHIKLMGMLEGHTIMAELGESEVHVHNQRELIGPYWVELTVPSAPLLEDSTAHIHAHVYEMLADSTRGPAVGGLEVHMAIHDPAGVETDLAVTEEAAGEYEAEYTFGAAGRYDLHVEIEVGGVPEEGEFHLPVHTPEELDGGHQNDNTGGHGHGGH